MMPSNMLLGKVVLEEAYEEPEKVEAKRKLLGVASCAPDDIPRWARQMASIQGERLELSKKHGIGYTILSVTGPGCQMIPDPDSAAQEATRLNNHLYSQIKDSREHFGAFASLSMHDPVQAGDELRRCVQDLGFHGALLYNFQHAGADAYTWLFYDDPRYDAFWAVACELDVPIYIHPSLPAGYRDEAFEKMYSGVGGKYLVGPPFQFATGVSLHLLRIIVSGVFDRFPKLQLIIGHLGERLPIDFWRINHWIQDNMKPIARANGDVICQRDDIRYYFRNNVYWTTSGDFYTPALKYVVDEVGVDRVLFSIDYPYETIERGCGWFDGERKEIEGVIGEEGYVRVGRENAKRLFGLGKYYQSDA